MTCPSKLVFDRITFRQIIWPKLFRLFELLSAFRQKQPVSAERQLFRQKQLFWQRHFISAERAYFGRNSLFLQNNLISAVSAEYSASAEIEACRNAETAKSLFRSDTISNCHSNSKLNAIPDAADAVLVPEVLDEAGLLRRDKVALEALELLLRLRPALLIPSQISAIRTDKVGEEIQG